SPRLDLDLDLRRLLAPLREREHDREQSRVVARPRPRRVDLHGQRDPALERAVVDLQLLDDAAPRGRTAPPAPDPQLLLDRVDVNLVRIDAGELDDDRQLVRLAREEAVDLRPEAAPRTGE